MSEPIALPPVEQIFALAADEQSLVSARPLLSGRYWHNQGHSPGRLWGRCQGSALFQVIVALPGLEFHCNCPSRKRPCRHVLGLLLLATMNPDEVPLAIEPEWVRDWNPSAPPKARGAGKERGATSSANPRGVQQREARIQAGVEQLELWLCDVIRQGLSRPEVAQPEFWEEPARRLVDAQAPGLAARVRTLSEIPLSAVGGPERLVGEMGRTMLLLQAWQRRDELDPELRMEIRQLVGWPVSQAELAQSGEAVRDRWIVIGQRETEEDPLRVQRSWVHGEESGRRGLILQFAPRRREYAEQIEPLTVFPAELMFYPGTTRQRARIRERTGPAELWLEHAGSLPGCDFVEEWLDQYSKSLAASPWHASELCVLKEVTLTRKALVWFVRDRSGGALPLRLQHPGVLLAESEGGPFDLFGEWDGRELIPLSCHVRGRVRPCR